MSWFRRKTLKDRMRRFMSESYWQQGPSDIMEQVLSDLFEATQSVWSEDNNPTTFAFLCEHLIKEGRRKGLSHDLMEKLFIDELPSQLSLQLTK